jgi:WD40 repeat protein
MTLRRTLLGCSLLLLNALVLCAQEASPFPREPVLRLQAGGPVAAVNALAFAPDGTLYAGGYDTLTRAWARGKGGVKPRATYRVPLGPGSAGAVNALAVSPDGRTLAVAGFGLTREATGFRQTGFLMPALGRMSDAMLQDRGTIYLFDTTRPGVLRALRGHRGPVLALSFAPAAAGKPPLLVSAARETVKARHVGLLRLWDASSGKQLAESGPWTDPGGSRPQLAAWHTGGATGEVRVALAGEGQPLQVWDAGGTKLLPVEPEPPGPFNRTVVFLPDPAGPTRGTLVTAHFAEPGTRLRRWRIEGTKAPRLLDAKPPLLAWGGAPVALALLPSAGKEVRAAAVLRFRDESPDPHKQLRLFLFALGADGLNVQGAPRGIRLWRSGQQPALAVSADGRSLAVGSNGAHEVLVFGVKGLLARRSRVSRRLASDGVIVSRVSFARRGKKRGLLLRAGDEPLVLDFEGTLTEGQGRWGSAAPANPNGWKAEPQKGKSGAVAGYRVGTPRASGRLVRLLPLQEPTAFALLPPCPPLGRPLLAVAYQELGVTYLALYDGSTGRQVRQYTGHVNPIGSLAFSRDGRLLASAGADKTVCVWSLTDLDRTLGKHATLAGLAVEKAEAGLRLAKLDRPLLNVVNRAALTKHGVKEGDAVEGIVGARGLRRFASPQAFYEALWQLAPVGRKGDPRTVTLQLGGKRRIDLQLDQGIDDLQPLFSLFVSRGPVGPHWLAWNPNGPYDTSDARLERRIGWHRNPARPGEPIQFDTAAKYRRAYQRVGLLRYLLERANLGEALDDWRKESVRRPDLRLGIDEVGLDAPRDRQGHPIIRRGPLTLHAEVYGVPLTRVKKVQWQLDGGARRDLDTDLGREQTADLGGLKWTRGLHELRLVVTTSDDAEHPQTLAVRYLPHRPAVAFDPDWLKKQFGASPSRPRRRVVAKPDLAVAASFTPGDNGPDGPKVKVSLRHNDRVVRGGSVVGREARWKVTLQEGPNVLEVRAENEGAGPDPGEESASRTLVVHYVKKPAYRPQITLESVQPEGGEVRPLLPFGDRAVVVSAPRVRIRGRISATDPLSAARLDGRALRGFVGGKRQVTIDETVELKPGARQVKFSARVGEGKVVERSLDLAYQPKVPRLDPGELRSLHRRLGQPRDFVLEVQLTELKYPYPYRASVRVNGDRKEVAAEVSKDGVLKAAVRLRPGDNSLLVVLRNGFQEHAEEVKVYCPRRPVILSLAGPGDVTRPRVDLLASVRTPADLPLLGARLNEEGLGGGVLALERTPDATRWTVRLAGVALTAGVNALRLRVRTRDGESLPQTLSVHYTPPPKPPKKPEVTLRQPRRDTPVAAPRFGLAFTVRSVGKTAVRVRLNGKLIAPGKPGTEDGAELYRLTVRGLQEGVNTVEVEADNAGGLTRVKGPIVSYTPPGTVEVHFDRLQRQDNGKFVPLKGPAPVGNLWLHGHVLWPDEDDPSRGERGPLQVWVNDSKQFPVMLGPRKGRRREFRVGMRLNRAQNRVHVALPERLKLKANTPPGFDLACAEPETKQRLHLLILAPGQRDGKKVQGAVLRAFLAEDVKGQNFRTPAFEDGIVYGPLPWNFKREKVQSQLHRIKMGIRTSWTRHLNDVVVVYFTGEEAIQGKKHYLLTEETRRVGLPEETALDCDELRQELSDFQGAKLLLLDTHRAPRRGAPRERAGGRGVGYVGLYSYVWLGRAQAPEKARLVRALRECLAREPLVRDHRSFLEKWASELGNDALFALVCPPGLEQLRLGKEGRR